MLLLCVNHSLTRFALSRHPRCSPPFFHSFDQVVRPFEDIEVQPQAAFQGDDWAVLQAIFAGRYTGQLPGAPAGSGQPFAVPFVSVFRLADGRIQRNTDYFDAYSFLIQIGALAAPGAATPTT